MKDSIRNEQNTVGIIPSRRNSITLTLGVKFGVKSNDTLGKKQKRRESLRKNEFSRFFCSFPALIVGD